MTFTLYIKPDGKSHYFKEMNMNRNSIVGCKLDKEMKKAFEKECRKEYRTVSSTLLLKCTRIGGHTYYQNIFIHGGCVHVQENKKEI